MNGHNGPPPPPPPPPGGRGPIFMGGEGRAGGPPPPPPPPPPMQPQGNGQSFQLPIRKQPVSSTRVVDITPRKPLDEDAYRRRLTTYEAHTIRKLPSRDSKEKPTWAKSDITKEPLSQEDISRAIKKLSESKRSVQDKKAALMPNQQGQVSRLLDDLMSTDSDPNFEWSLAQIDRKEFKNRQGQRETSTLTIYVKRAPQKDLNPKLLFDQMEKDKKQQLQQQQPRPAPGPPPPQQFQQQNPHHGPPPPQQFQQQQPHQAQGPPQFQRLPQQNGHAGPPPPPNNIRPGPLPPQIVMGQMKQGKNGHKSMLPRPRKKYHDDRSSVSSDFSSDSDGGESDYSSNTEFSSSTDRRHRKYNHKGRSHSRHREHHRKAYRLDNRAYSPEPIRHRDAAPYRVVPEVPQRAVPIVGIPAFDPVAAAYQAGKIDADAERFDRYPRSPLPIAVEPRAIVSYGRSFEREPRFETRDPRYVEQRFEAREPRYVERRFETREPRYADEIRYVDDLREEDLLRRRRRDAEEYMDRRANESPIREPRVIYTNTNPFTPRAPPRGYARSHSDNSGW